MATPHRTPRPLAVFVGTLSLLLPMLGCSLWDRDHPGPSGASADAAKPGDKELPAKQSAQLCLATAQAMQDKGQFQQAIDLYEKARRDDPALTSVAHRLAFLYDRQGDGVRALAEYQKALKAQPKDPNLLNDLGYYHYHRGNFAEAEKRFRQAIGIAADHKQARTNLALVLGHDGRFPESYELFAQVVGPAAAHSNVGVLMARQGRYDQARQEFRQALALDPTLKQPRTFLDYLDRRRPSDKPPLADAVSAAVTP